MKQLINHAIENPETGAAILLVIFELLVRLKPTKRNLSLLDFLHRAINLILPNFTNVTKRDKLKEVRNKIELALKNKVESKKRGLFKIR
jgi:hypothetical protein